MRGATCATCASHARDGAPELDVVLLPTRRKARIDGFDLDAEVCVQEHERERLEHLCRYVLRPPLALDRWTWRKATGSPSRVRLAIACLLLGCSGTALPATGTTEAEPAAPTAPTRTDEADEPEAPAPSGEEALTTPRRVEGIEGATAIGVDDSLSCALDGARRVLCWGDEALAALPGGRRRGLADPIHVPGLDGHTELAVGGQTVCARSGRHAPACRGMAAAAPEQPEPWAEEAVTIDWLEDTESLAVNGDLVCGIRAGRVRCHDSAYASDDGGELTVRRFVLPDVVDAARIVLSSSRAALRTRGGRVAALDLNLAGDIFWAPGTWESDLLAVQHVSVCSVESERLRCFAPPSHTSSDPPPVVGALVRLAGGYSHLCGVDQQGAVTCWGNNERGALGRLPLGPRLGPGLVDALPPARDVAVGRHHACALTTTGDVYCWGQQTGG